jgi:hypothetical protein
LTLGFWHVTASFATSQRVSDAAQAKKLLDEPKSWNLPYTNEYAPRDEEACLVDEPFALDDD